MRPWGPIQNEDWRQELRGHRFPSKYASRMQVNELCEAANKEVGAEEGVRIANFLCNGNYAVSGGLPGCEVGLTP